MKYKLILIVFVIFALQGCGKKYEITPENLDVAHVNQFYHQVIHISGGKVIDKHKPLNTDIPKDLGVEVRPVDDLDGYNRIEIKGTPKYKGTFTVHISAGFYAGGDAEIDKKYTFIVQE
ncbi:hypothetical protein [Acinetobacter gyllenbergii]|uniref:hypothetical protein n=1 Tax=Acinetobacter gyllenbergii TaxID=134534 RepID=UPI00080683B0|nr:hypothetical protein [Acinetobacter gyllenbergii]OBY74893.1 hypothetical protein NG55_08130 [Acinetobacter gyllenbergii]